MYLHACLSKQNSRQRMGSYCMVLNLSWLSLFFISSSSLPPPSVLLLLSHSLSFHLLYVIIHPSAWSLSPHSFSLLIFTLVYPTFLLHTVVFLLFLFPSIFLFLQISFVLLYPPPPHPPPPWWMVYSTPPWTLLLLLFAFIPCSLHSCLHSEHNEIFAASPFTCPVPNL